MYDKIYKMHTYITYDEALKTLNLDSLKERRLKIAKKFALGCKDIPEMADLFQAPEDCTYI